MASDGSGIFAKQNVSARDLINAGTKRHGEKTERGARNLAEPRKIAGF
jgi:hypothetical protein